MPNRKNMKEVTILSEKKKFDPFAGPEITCVVHTTQAQKEIWIACKLGGKDANRAYNESISLLLKGEVKQGALEHALQILVARHESLQAIFSSDGRFMSIFETLTIPLFFKDISSFPETEKENSIKSYLHTDAQHVFDLVDGPLLKVGLLKISQEKYQLVLTAHHIICDGWSLGIMLQELGMLYSAYINNTTPELPEPARFSDYSDGQQALVESNEYKEIERFWLQQYKKPIPQLDLPIDFPRPEKRTYKSARLDFPLDTNLLAALKKTGLQAGCSFVTTLLSAFELFLYQLSGQENIVVGLPAASQSLAGTKHLVGHCANLLPLRSSVNSAISFSQYLKQRKSALFDAYEHEQLSFGELLKKLSIARDPSRVPLVPVVFNIDLGLADGVNFSGLTYEVKSNPRQYEIFEIFLNATGTEENLIMEWSYNTALFKASIIEKMMDSFELVIKNLMDKPDKTISEILQCDYAAYFNLNDTEATYSELPLHELLARQALMSPNRLAFKFNEVEISYKNLQAQANQLANYFIAQGVSQGDFVGVCLPRTSEMFISLLAIQKCGAAYLPLDPSYPRQRMEFMLKDSEAKFLITTKDFSTSFAVAPKILIIEEAIEGMRQFPKIAPKIDVSQEAIAYLLYTSGSTGKPKGVPVTHRSLVNLLCSLIKEPGITKNDKMLAITTISFDIAGVELYLPLLTSACVVLADTETVRDGRLMLKMLESEDITVLQATPTTWQMLLDANWKRPLNLKAFCGGEALTSNLAHQLLAKCDSLWNMYGPTETTIYSVIKQILTDDEPICIGKPIANTQLYILNEQGQIATPGKVGEIVIGGDGVSKGYWKLDELTFEKFIPNVFTEPVSGKFYRTGDLGKLLPRGEVQCLGRVDHQVKIRGHRIEPGEIEQALISLHDIQAAAVLAHEDRLIAFVVPMKKSEATSEQTRKWREALTNILPKYLIPQEFRILQALPTTPNGKLDRNALLNNTNITTSNTASPEFHSAPRTEAEKLIANIWKKCLDLDEVDIFSNFFELGGHSLAALQVMTLLEKETGKTLPVAALFEYSTIEKLAMLLTVEDGTFITGDSLLPIKPKGSKIPLYLIHGVGLNILKLNGLANNLNDDQPVYGLQGTGIDAKGKTLGSVEEIAAHYVATITKVNPNGPYALAGHSYGGIIAFEMACQLTKKGKKINTLIMLDTYVEPSYYHKSLFRKKLALVEYQAGRIFYALNQMSRSWDKFNFLLNRKKEKILNKYYRNNRGKTEEQKLQEQTLLDTANINDVMMRRYHILPQHFNIDLLRAKEKGYFMHDPVYLGWKDLALKGLQVHDVPGNHLDMFAPPNDEVAAKVLQEILDRQNIDC